ncbi:hypothetical protein ETP1_047 [Edwardsiella phage ETP-1]|uniref:Uncharacterized protein n=1 Tax=Edwardsiella phage ETP-1 TaxID=2544920 RepID=A0A6G5P4D5_9CAUD|nr:hypothetical protein ETP1_047 [Edwardsiella phage ETP-1]UIS54102.1 hypothetical protein ZHX_gp42 [Edwardsiella phage vB_EpP_ZHX]
MAVYTFSAKEKKPEDVETVEAVKAYCERFNLNFSGVVVELLKKYKAEVVDERTR